MKRRNMFSRMILLTMALALVAAACGTDDAADQPPETVIVTVPGDTVIVEVEVPA